MTTEVVFETATIADAIKAAEKVAPNKGQAFDKSAGIVIEVNPADNSVLVRATNTDLYHMAWIDSVSATGPAVTWRLPSDLFARHLSSLPIGSGKNVTFTQVKNSLRVEQGRIKARFNLMDTDLYPVWTAFDPDLLQPVKDFGGKVALVEWAAAKGEIPLCGVHLDGEIAVCTDRYRLAAMPLEIPGMTESITVPAGLLGGLLRETGEIGVAVDAHQLLLMPDEHTQIRAVIYGEEYKNVSRIMENNRDHPEVVKLRKSAVLEVMGRAMNFVGSERTPTIRIFLGGEEMGCMMQDQEKAMIGDVVELPGQALHDKVELKFTPKNLMDAIEQAPNDELELFYEPARPNRIIYINGGSGYEAWVMPRKETSNG